MSFVSQVKAFLASPSNIQGLTTAFGTLVGIATGYASGHVALGVAIGAAAKAAAQIAAPDNTALLSDLPKLVSDSVALYTGHTVGEVVTVAQDAVKVVADVETPAVPAAPAAVPAAPAAEVPKNA